MFLNGHSDRDSIQNQLIKIGDSFAVCSYEGGTRESGGGDESLLSAPLF